MNVKQLIEEVLTDLGNNSSIDSVASKVQIIARLLKNDNFISWVSKEFLTGYNEEDDLPSYRISFSPEIKADYIVNQGFGLVQVKNQSVPVSNLGLEKYRKIMEIRFLDALPSIVEYSKNVDKLSVSLNPYERVSIQEVLGDAQIMSCHKTISPSSFMTIIQSVKARLIDFFMDFDDELLNNSIDFNAINQKDNIQRMVNNYFPNAGVVNTGEGSISIEHSNVVAGSSNNVELEHQKQELSSILDKLETLANSNECISSDISETLTIMRTELKQQKPKGNVLRMGFNAIKGIAKAMVLSGIDEIVEEGLTKLNVFGL